jgi:hypothetical protein
VILVAMMLAPTLGTLAVVGVLRRRPGTLRFTGVTSERGVRSWLPWAVLAWLGPIVLVGLSLVLGAAVGVFHADLVSFSAFREVLGGRSAIPVQTLVLIQIAEVLVVGWINVIPALAEEWGGVAGCCRWGAGPRSCWSGSYGARADRAARLQLPARTGPAAGAADGRLLRRDGSLLGWLRLRSDSVWPCAIGHGFVNAAAGLPIVLAAAGHPIDNATTGLPGWTGWVVMELALGVAALVPRQTVLTGR